MSIPFIHTNNELKIASENNLVDCILNNKILFNWNYGLYGASLGNNKIILEKMIKLGASDFNWALRGMSQNGDIKMIESIEQILLNQNQKPNYDWALAGACLGNNTSGVKYLLTKEIKDLNSSFRIVCEQGNQEIFNIIYNDKKDILDTTIGLAGACYGCRKISNYPINIIKELSYNLKGNHHDTALYEASYSGFEEIIDKIKNKFENSDNIQIVRGLTLGNHIDLLKKYLTNETINMGYYEATYDENIEMIDWYEKEFNLERNVYYLTGKCQSKKNNLELLKEPIKCLWCLKTHC